MFLNVKWIEVVALVDDHVFDSVDDLQEAVFEVTQVAGQVLAFRINDFRSGRGVVEVAEETHDWSDGDFAHRFLKFLVDLSVYQFPLLVRDFHGFACPQAINVQIVFFCEEEREPSDFRHALARFEINVTDLTEYFPQLPVVKTLSTHIPVL